MSISRRKFLRAGTLVALSAALPLGVFGQSRKDKNGIHMTPTDPQNPIDPIDLSDPLANYNRSVFSSYLNSIFQLYTGYSVVAVALLEVKDMLPASTPANGRECFSLLFRGGIVALPQSTYRIDHPSLGSFQLFLVPGGPDDNGAQSYVAIINRLAYVNGYYDQLTAPPSGPPSASPGPSDRARPQPPATPPTTTRPAEGQSPKPQRKRKPSWKSGDNEDLEGGIDQ